MESVWDYPRPPAVVPCERRVRVELAGHVVAESSQALRVLETARPPTLYVPPEDVALELLRETFGHTVCEWKGRAHYADVAVSADRAPRAAWWYPAPQDGDFCGGWITDEISGPFKGAVGTLHW
jgi:uncharacterized protein (DUF427 family)